MDVSTVRESRVDIEELAEMLDLLDPEGRVQTMRTWDKKRMAAIFDACAGRPITLEQVVPRSIGADVEVIHDLRNTLPLFNDAQKRFARTADGGIGGYNRQHGIARVSEPGYFGVRQGEGAHANELVIDYGQVPTSKPRSWPRIEANDKGLLNGIVWGGMVDYLRKVSHHVSIGFATKGGKPIGQYFALVRREPS